MDIQLFIIFVFFKKKKKKAGYKRTRGRSRSLSMVSAKRLRLSSESAARSMSRPPRDVSGVKDPQVFHRYFYCNGLRSLCFAFRQLIELRLICAKCLRFIVLRSIHE